MQKSLRRTTTPTASTSTSLSATTTPSAATAWSRPPRPPRRLLPSRSSRAPGCWATLRGARPLPGPPLTRTKKRSRRGLLRRSESCGRRPRRRRLRTTTRSTSRAPLPPQPPQLQPQGATRRERQHWRRPRGCWSAAGGRRWTTWSSLPAHFRSTSSPRAPSWTQVKQREEEGE